MAHAKDGQASAVKPGLTLTRTHHAVKDDRLRVWAMREIRPE